MRENYKFFAPRRVEIIACKIGRAKKVAIYDSQEITKVAYLCQITNIGSDRPRKLLNEGSQEGRDIRVRNLASEKDCRLRIARNCTGSIFRPSNEYWKQSHAKIIK